MREVRTTETRKKAVVWTAIAVLLLTLYPNSMKAQRLADGFAQADTLCLRFRLDSVVIDMSYADNAAVWQQFEQNFLRHFDGVPSRRLRLDIFSGASPEGTAAHNRWLGENRGIAIRRLVRQRLPGRVGTFVIHNEAARWDAFYEAVAQSHEPWRDEVLRIIDLPASQDETQWDHRERKLRALRGGTVWPVLLEKYLAPLRSGATAIVTWQRDTLVVVDSMLLAPRPGRYPALGGYPATGAYPGPDGNYPGLGGYPGPGSLFPSGIPYPGLRFPGLYPGPCCLGRLGFPGSLVYADPQGYLRRTADSTRVHKPVVRRPVWILRTNLPVLGTGTPNLQAEWSLGHRDKWSLNVEGIWSWWTLAHNAYANELMFGSVELRRFLGNRRRHHTLDGWHIGLGLGVGYYDLEWKSYGFQGEVAMGYINIGWQRRFGRRKQWAFDAGVGLGDLFTYYRRYWGSSKFPIGHEERYDDHLMWKHTGHTNWIGAPHANISVGYCFPQRHSAQRRARADERDAERARYLHFRDSLIAQERAERDAEQARYLHFRDSLIALERAERDSLRSAWGAMSKSERKVARKEWSQRQKELRRRERLDEIIENNARKAEREALRFRSAGPDRKEDTDE